MEGVQWAPGVGVVGRTSAGDWSGGLMLGWREGSLPLKPTRESGNLLNSIWGGERGFSPLKQLGNFEKWKMAALVRYHTVESCFACCKQMLLVFYVTLCESIITYCLL